MNELKSLEGILAPASKHDLGSDLQSVSKLQERFNSTKPQFLVWTGIWNLYTTHKIRFDSGHNKTIQWCNRLENTSTTKNNSKAKTKLTSTLTEIRSLSNITYSLLIDFSLCQSERWQTREIDAEDIYNRRKYEPKWIYWSLYSCLFLSRAFVWCYFRYTVNRAFFFHIRIL